MAPPIKKHPWKTTYTGGENLDPPEDPMERANEEDETDGRGYGGDPPGSPDDDASDDPLVNLNFNFVQLIKLLHADAERRHKIDERLVQVAQNSAYDYREYLSGIRASLEGIRFSVGSIANRPGPLGRLKKFVHRITAP